MKNCLLIAFTVFCSHTMLAQTSTFGLTGGFLHVTGTIDIEDNEVDAKEKSGAFLGIVGDFAFSEKVHFQPEVLYARNDDYGLLMIPLVLKFYPIQNLNLQIGPQIDYSTDPYPIDGPLAFAQENGFEIGEDDFTRLGISLTTGIGLDINEHFFLESRYTFQINDVYTGSLNISIKGHILNAGLGYRF